MELRASFVILRVTSSVDIDCLGDLRPFCFLFFFWGGGGGGG